MCSHFIGSIEKKNYALGLKIEFCSLRCVKITKALVRAVQKTGWGASGCLALVVVSHHLCTGFLLEKGWKDGVDSFWCNYGKAIVVKIKVGTNYNDGKG